MSHNIEILEKINKKFPWKDRESEFADRIGNEVDALASLRYSIRVINEFDGEPNSFKESTAQAVGDLSAILLSIQSNLASAANLHPSFTLRASNKGWDRLDEYKTTWYQEIWQIVGLEAICGKYVLYQHEIHGYKDRTDKYIYGARILRLTDVDHYNIFERN